MSWRVMTSPSMPCDLGDVGDATRAVPETGEVHDQVERGRHLLTDGPDRQVEAGHEHQRLEAGERVTGAVGVDRGQIEPSWPVFMAWSMSSASPPGTRRRRCGRAACGGSS